MSSPKKYGKVSKLVSTKSRTQRLSNVEDDVATPVVAPSPAVVKPALSKVLQEALRKASEAAVARLDALKAEIAKKNALADKGKGKEVVSIVSTTPVAPVAIEKVIENSTETDVTTERKERKARKALKKAIKAAALKAKIEQQGQTHKRSEHASNSGTTSPAIQQSLATIPSPKKQKKRPREDSLEREQPIASTSATQLQDDQPSKAKKSKKNSVISTPTLINKNISLSATPSRPLASTTSTATSLPASNSKKRKAPTSSTPKASIPVASSSSSHDAILARSESQRQATIDKIVSSLIASNPSMGANRVPLPPLPSLASISTSSSTSTFSPPSNQFEPVLARSSYNGPDILRFLSFSFLGMNDLVENGSLQICDTPLQISANIPQSSQKGKEKERLVDVGVNTIIDKAAEEASRLLLEQQGEEILELEMKTQSMEEEIAKLAADKLKSETDQQKKLEDKQRKKERKALGLAKKLKEDASLVNQKVQEEAVLATERQKVTELQLMEVRMVEEIDITAKKESKKIAKANKKALKAEKKAKKLAKVIASRQKILEVEIESELGEEDVTMAIEDLEVVVEQVQTENEEESDSIEELPVSVEEIVEPVDDDEMISAEEVDEVAEEEESKESEDDVEAFESAPENLDEIVSTSTLPKSSSSPISVTSEPIRLSSPIQLDSAATIVNRVEESEAEPSTADESEEEIDQLAGSTPKVEHPSSRAFKDSTPSSPEDAGELALSLSQHASPDRRRIIPALTRLGGSQLRGLTVSTFTSSTPLRTSTTSPFTPVASAAASAQSPVVTIGAGDDEDSSSSDDDDDEDEEEDDEENFDASPPKAKKARTSIGASAFAAFGKSTPKPLLKTPIVVVEKPLLDLEIDDEEYDQLMTQPSQSVRADRILAAVEAEEAEEAEEEDQESELEEGQIAETNDMDVDEAVKSQLEVEQSSQRSSGKRIGNGIKVNLVESQEQILPVIEKLNDEIVEETQDEEFDQLVSQFPTPNLIPPTPDSKVPAKNGRATTPRPNSLPAGLLEFVNTTGFTPPESRTMPNSSQLSLPEEALTFSSINRKTFSDAGDSPHIPISDEEGSPRPEESQFVPLVKEPLFSLESQSQSQSQSQSLTEQNRNGGSYVSKRSGNGSPSKITSIASPTAHFSIEIEVPRNGLLSPPRARQTRSATSRSPSPGTQVAASQPIVKISNVRGTPRREMFSQPEPGNSVGSVASNRRLASKLPGLDALPSGSISRRSSRNVVSSQVSIATPTKVNWKGKGKGHDDEDEDNEEDDSDNEIIVAKGKGKGKAKLWE